ncbi:MAG: hypothetical protein K8F92_14165 [Hyphomicrobium sp.]|uniref:hypothetical protein n=1 Tax=Hyphomicrobium sp. TaxID=82 RepID=UPI001326DBEE|nr:hypothetical protein [Hyphomicrobium sp.]KAB2940964.1 MAG: hypothetical protein F9K20_11565 [Hyphomicrobium sp.]MBZ0210781.1 hypothetical protein [Hyphomicrobium sp.]
MGRSSLITLLIMSALVSHAKAATTIQLALPSQQPDGPPPRPVGDPDVAPIGLDLFEPESSLEEAWPWPPASTDN